MLWGNIVWVVGGPGQRELADASMHLVEREDVPGAEEARFAAGAGVE